jgi:phosphoesterase RecJ-like protein
MTTNFPDRFKDIAEFIQSGNQFLITTHYSPDGDAIGSCLSFGQILSCFGKEYAIAIEKGAPEKYDFIPEIANIIDPSLTEFPRIYHYLITLDVGSYKRIGTVATLVADSPKILNIDHHLSNDGFGDVAFIDGEASSTCEILFHLAQFLKIPISPALATDLYIGIMTDTGRFRFGNTSPRALKACADLVELGADPVKITEHIYFDLPRKYIEALGKILYSLEFHLDGRLALMEYHSTEEIEDAEGFIDYAIGIRGVKVAVFIRLIPDEGKFKVSIRSRGDLDVRHIAETYGGGGHPNASGFRFRGSLKDLKQGLINTILLRLDQK